MSKPPTRINVRAQTLDSPKDSPKSSTVKIAPVKDRQMASKLGHMCIVIVKPWKLSLASLEMR